MSAKSTPGPWSVQYEPEGGYDTLSSAYRLLDAEGHRVVEVDTRDYDDCVETAEPDEWGNVETSERAEANAHLIAAAPDLLAALKDLLCNPAYQVAVGGNPAAVQTMLARCHAAIEKAEGR
jgi:hypothetical protein